MQITRFVHVNVVVRDLERTLAFYTEVMGAKVLERLEERRVDIREPMGVSSEGARDYVAALLYWNDDRHGPYVDVIEWQYAEDQTERLDPRPPLGAQDLGWARIALQVDDLKAWERHLEEHHVPIKAPARWEVQGSWKLGLLVLEDPDGTLIELVEFPEGISRRGSIGAEILTSSRGMPNASM